MHRRSALRVGAPTIAAVLALALALLLPLGVSAAARATSVKGCMARSGTQASRCLAKYTGAVERCRRRRDAACEAALRANGAALEQLQAGIEPRIGEACGIEVARPLGYTSPTDVVLRATEACADFAEDALSIAHGADAHAALSEEALACRRQVTRQLRGLRAKTVSLHGPRCHVPQIAGRGCDRVKRDARLSAKAASVRTEILRSCGTAFDELALSPLDVGATSLDERVDELVDRAARHARHFAQLAYPPNDLGPDADFGPYPVGVTTLALSDPSRLDVAGNAPRPVTTEVYYPSTPAAVAGLSGDVVQVFGIDVVETPAFRDVAVADGRFPLVLFSHGNNGVRFQSFYFSAHLASHGYVVVAPDHHGNTFVDTLQGTVDAESRVNRPLDMSFLIDTMTALDAEPGGRFEGAIDEDAVGASGHSFGGYTTWALAGPAFDVGTFTDTRVSAILPQAPSSGGFSDEFFQAISIPTLVVGGSLDETTPFATSQQAPYDQLQPGASIVALAKLVDGGHFTFSDYCEVPRSLLSFLGGFEEACEPRHLPWRHAHDVANYLTLNFFDGTLKGDAADLAKLTPAALAWIEDLAFQRK